MIKKSAYISMFALLIVAIISCEKDFKDIATSVISNSKFDTKDTIIEIEVSNKPVVHVIGDGLGIGGSLGQYLLGVYNNPNYEKIEASTVSQLALDENVNTADKIYGADTTVVTTIDTVFLKIPYQATLKEGTTSDYTLDSIIGDQTKAFNLNVYRTDTYMNRLNPANPSALNRYYTDAAYQILPGELNSQLNFQFKPNPLDTVLLFKRRLSNGEIYKTDTVKLANNTPFARIPLKEDVIKQLFVDEFGGANFETQEALNEYFKGLYIEASGNEGSLLSFNISTSETALRPAIEIRYTKTVIKGASTIVDTIAKSSTFLLSNFTNSIYKMEDKVYPDDKNIVLQGAAGSMANVKFLDPTQLAYFRTKEWLINDATITFYVNQDIVGNDTISTPYKLFLYKDETVPTQIKDQISEGPTTFSGRITFTDKKPDYYSFRITDYISDLFSGAIKYNPTLGLKVYNTTDTPLTTTDTIVKNYSWNPKAVTILNHLSSNGNRRARLKISYSVKK